MNSVFAFSHFLFSILEMSVPLNKDVLQLIALKLPTKDLGNFFLVCKLCQHMSSDYFWTLKLKHDYSVDSLLQNYTPLNLYKKYVRFMDGEARVIDLKQTHDSLDWGGWLTDGHMNDAFTEKCLPELSLHNPKKGDIIHYGEFWYSQSFIFDGQRMNHIQITLPRIPPRRRLGDVIIDKCFRVIEEFDCYYWSRNLNAEVYFDPTPYEKEIRDRYHRYSYGVISWSSDSYFTDFRGKVYRVQVDEARGIEGILSNRWWRVDRTFTSEYYAKLYHC